MLSVKSAINKSFNKDRPANILTIFYDGVFDCTLAETGHNFYGAVNQSCYQWSHLAECKPENIHICEKEELYATDFDFILINDRIRNKDSIGIYIDYFSIPAIVVDHDISGENKYISKNLVPGYCLTVADTPDVQNSFLSTLLVEPYFPTVDIEKDVDFIIIGDFLETDKKAIEGILQLSSNSVFIGNLNIKNKVEPKSYDEYINWIHRAKVFVLLNTHPGICYNAIRALYSGSMLCSTPNRVLENYLKQKIAGGSEIHYTIDPVAEIGPSITESLKKYERSPVLWEMPSKNYKSIFDRKLNEVLIV